MRKSKIVLITVLMIFLFVQTVHAEENSLKFTDLNETHWSYESIEKLVKAGYINGYPDGTFKPEGYITRAELVKIANQIFKYTEKLETTDFTDISSNEWYYENVLIAQKAGYINGYPDGTFKPNDLISREEISKILDTINNFVKLPFNNEPADYVSPWAVESVNKVLSNRIMLLNQNNNFRATEKATRAEACDALAKFVIEDASIEQPQLPVGGGSNSGNEMTQEELYQTMDDTRIIIEEKILNDSELSDDQKDIVEDIINNMEKYQQNNNHDYEKAAETTYEKYEQLSDPEKKELEDKITTKIPTQYLLDLKEFFFPDVDLD